MRDEIDADQHNGGDTEDPRKEVFAHVVLQKVVDERRLRMSPNRIDRRISLRRVGPVVAHATVDADAHWWTAMKGCSRMRTRNYRLHPILDGHTVHAMNCSVVNLADMKWVAQCAHRLHEQWPWADPASLEEAAAELCEDGELRSLTPTLAAHTWLRLRAPDGEGAMHAGI